MGTVPLFTADKYTYRLLRNESTQRYVGVCSEFSDLKYEATIARDALDGIQNRVSQEIARLSGQNIPVPEPLAFRRFGP